MPASPPSARVENGCRSPTSISCSGHGVNALLRWPHALMVTGTLLILHSPKVSPLQQRLFVGISPAGSSLPWWSVIHRTLAVNSNESYGLSSVDEGHAQPPRRGNLVVQREGHQKMWNLTSIAWIASFGLRTARGSDGTRLCCGHTPIGQEVNKSED